MLGRRIGGAEVPTPRILGAKEPPDGAEAPVP